jgi:hypothetical protein
MTVRVSYEGQDLGTVRVEDGKPLVGVADEAHRAHLEEVFDQVRGGYNDRWDVHLFNTPLRTLKKEGYAFAPVNSE